MARDPRRFGAGRKDPGTGWPGVIGAPVGAPPSLASLSFGGDLARARGLCADLAADLGRGVLHLLFPPRCIACDTGLADDHALCPACWADTGFLQGLVCDCCGLDLPGSSDCAEYCDDCRAFAPPWSRGRAAMRYGGTGRDLVLAFKHGDRLDLLPAFTGWLARAAQPLLRPDLLLAPVPLHWGRLLQRRFNQAALLSGALARRLGLAHCPDLLRRPHATPSQEGRSRLARHENLAGAITVTPRHRHRLAGRHILLVDDVMTSGATFSAATTACLAQGAASVMVLALARVAKGQGMA